MDSSSEEDEEEFFETFEDIPSSPDPERGKDVKRHSNESQGHMGRVQDGQTRSQPSFSRYEIWKSNPGSILERRQRLLSQMGLKLEREDPDNTVVVFETATSVSKPSTSAATFLAPASDGENNTNDVGPSGRSRSGSKDLGSSKASDVLIDKTAVVTDAREPGWTMARSRSDGTFSRLLSGHRIDSFSARLVRSGTTSPVLSHRGNERLVDDSGAVLRTDSSGPSHPASKPPLGARRTSATGTPFLEGIALQRSIPFSNNVERAKFTDRNGKDCKSLDRDRDDETVQRLLKNGRISVESSEDLKNSEYGDVLCRIKDLDSGKEFVVNEVGKDGLCNKLRELDTGRELTLEEFETSLGLSPIVQEVMRRERQADDTSVTDTRMVAGSGGLKTKKGWLKVIKGVVRSSLEKGNRSSHGNGSDNRELSIEKSGRRSGSATDDSQDSPLQTTKRVKVHAHKKAIKEFAGLHLMQEIQAHQGAIWTMKFSLDSSYLASAGQDKVVRVWEVLEQNGRGGGSFDSLGEFNSGVDKVIVENSPQRQKETKKGGMVFPGRKHIPSSTLRLPRLFLLSEISKCAFEGHTEDILDLSWSPSQSLLSSSMDKTVRLWNVLSGECLRIFTHNDYVTCIQFNPVDDGYFISGSLDEKVRIWSIQERQVVDWADLREMVTAACYTPDGQGAVVGSYKGNCRFYKTSGNKLQLGRTFEVRSSKSKRSHGKKINGFQFIPGDQDKVLITSSDSCIRLYDGTKLSYKYKGFRNSKTQISASCSPNGRYIICASEDSRVCIWNYYDSNSGHLAQRKEKSGSYEDFSARHVLVAIPWPGMGMSSQLNIGEQKLLHKSDSPLMSKKDVSTSEMKVVSGDNSPRSISSVCSDPCVDICCQFSPCREKSAADGAPILTAQESRESLTGGLNESKVEMCSPEVDHAGYLVHDNKASSFSGGISFSSSILDSTIEDSRGGTIFSKGMPVQQVGSHGFFSDSKGSATWPEEKLPPVQQTSINAIDHTTNSRTTEVVSTEENGADRGVTAIASAWDLVIVTAGRGGEIHIFQNYSLPVRL